jgi:hypothetical protein
VAASFAVRSAFEKPAEAFDSAQARAFDSAQARAFDSAQARESRAERIYVFDALPHYGWKESKGPVKLQLGHLKISSHLTLEEKDIVFASLELGPSNFRIFTTGFESREKLKSLEGEIFRSLEEGPEKVLEKIREYFGPHTITIKDLPLHERMLVLESFTKQVVEKMGEVYERLYESNRGMNEIYRSVNLPVPEEIRSAVAHTLARRLNSSVAELVRGGFDIKKAKEVYHILQEAKSFEVELKLGEVEKFLGAELKNRIHLFSKSPDPLAVAQCLHLLKAAAKVQARLDLRGVQDEMFYRVRSWTRGAGLPAGQAGKFPQFSAGDADSLLELLVALGLSPENLRKMSLHLKGQTARSGLLKPVHAVDV